LIGLGRGKACFVPWFHDLSCHSLAREENPKTIVWKFFSSEWFDIRFEHEDGPLFYMENAKTLHKAESVSSP
jgi:hypothetical protein